MRHCPIKPQQQTGGNPKSIDRRLSDAQQWVFFDNALALPRGEDPEARRIAASKLATSSERRLAIMHKVTGRYQQMA